MFLKQPRNRKDLNQPQIENGSVAVHSKGCWEINNHSKLNTFTLRTGFQQTTWTIQIPSGEKF